jgi:hypothetical protein
MGRGEIMAVTAGMVKELREKTGAGMMDCKKALSETDGDLERAIDYLRQRNVPCFDSPERLKTALTALDSYSQYFRGAGFVSTNE